MLTVVHELPLLHLCDTPGLKDPGLAKAAAEQIKAALEIKPNARV